MICARDDDYFRDNAHEEHCNVSLSHAREKIARVSACGVLFSPSVACKGIAISCERNFL